jgi:hypothetical protein
MSMHLATITIGNREHLVLDSAFERAVQECRDVGLIEVSRGLNTHGQRTCYFDKPDGDAPAITMAGYMKTAELQPYQREWIRRWEAMTHEQREGIVTTLNAMVRAGTVKLPEQVGHGVTQPQEMATVSVAGQPEFTIPVTPGMTGISVDHGTAWIEMEDGTTFPLEPGPEYTFRKPRKPGRRAATLAPRR